MLTGNDALFRYLCSGTGWYLVVSHAFVLPRFATAAGQRGFSGFRLKVWPWSVVRKKSVYKTYRYLTDLLPYYYM